MGTLLRIIILLAGLWLVVHVVRRALNPPPKSGNPDSLPPADMLRCHYCGVFVPRADAVAARGQHYCSNSHAEADDTKN